MKNYFQKILIILIVISTFFSASVFLKETNAVLSLLPVQLVEIATQIYQYAKEYMYPALRDAAIKRIADQITDDTVQWIENGGEPRFVSDWNGFLEDNFSAAVGDVVLQTRAAPLCSPFKVQVGFMLLPKRTLSERARCTIEDIGLNLQNFYDDFSSGGWIGYSESWAPQNNYFMTAMMVYDEALIAGQKAQQAKVKEAEGGGGFLSVKKCLQTIGETDGFKDCVANSGDEAYCEGIYGKKDVCEKETAITPGNAVGEMFRDAVTSDSQWARSAQSALALIADALVNRVVKEGVDYVKDAKQREQQRKDDQKKQDDIEKTNYQQGISSFMKTINDFTAEWNYIGNAKQGSYDVINGSNGLLATLNEMKTRNCQPPHSATDVEINSTQTLSISLNAETADFESKIAQANKISQDLNNAVDGTNRDRIIAQQNYFDFDSQYNTIEMKDQIYDGSVRRAADAELASLQGKLTDARNRLQLCIQAQTPQY